jgi:hypothetical protein
MVAGGDLGLGSGPSNTTEVLDVRTMGLARRYCAAVQVDAKHIIVIGGQDSSSTPLATTELLDVATMAFEPGPTMQTARSNIAAIYLDAAEEEPRIIVLGGGESTTEVLALDA